jgi:hypothetical protein
MLYPIALLKKVACVLIFPEALHFSWAWVIQLWWIITRNFSRAGQNFHFGGSNLTSCWVCVLWFLWSIILRWLLTVNFLIIFSVKTNGPAVSEESSELLTSLHGSWVKPSLRVTCFSSTGWFSWLIILWLII